MEAPRPEQDTDWKAIMLTMRKWATFNVVVLLLVSLFLTSVLQYSINYWVPRISGSSNAGVSYWYCYLGTVCGGITVAIPLAVFTHAVKRAEKGG